jgi:hypothetical protein
MNRKTIIANAAGRFQSDFLVDMFSPKNSVPKFSTQPPEKCRSQDVLVARLLCVVVETFVAKAGKKWFGLCVTP